MPCEHTSEWLDLWTRIHKDITRDGSWRLVRESSKSYQSEDGIAIRLHRSFYAPAYVGNAYVRDCLEDNEVPPCFQTITAACEDGRCNEQLYLAADPDHRRILGEGDERNGAFAVRIDSLEYVQPLLRCLFPSLPWYVRWAPRIRWVSTRKRHAD